MTPDRNTLLAIGVSLVMAGLFLRGFARGIRRDLARRRQHQLDDRKPDNAGRGGALEKPPTWWEKNAGAIANVVALAGLGFTVAAFFRD